MSLFVLLGGAKLPHRITILLLQNSNLPASALVFIIDLIPNATNALCWLSLYNTILYVD